MKNYLKLSLIVLIIFVISSCGSPDGNEEQLVKECFEGYKAAILESNGEEAIKWVDKTTLDYYSEILEISISADSATVQELGFLDRLTVLTVRLRISEEEIFAMDGNSFFIYAIDEGMIGKNSVMAIEIGDVDVIGDFAKSEIITNGRRAPFYFHFNKESENWKIDITSIFAPSAEGIKQAIKDNGQTENEFIFSTLEYLTGKVVESEIWQPIKQVD